jgi:hypothetical protein
MFIEGNDDVATRAGRKGGDFSVKQFSESLSNTGGILYSDGNVVNHGKCLCD